MGKLPWPHRMLAEAGVPGPGLSDRYLTTQHLNPWQIPDRSGAELMANLRGSQRTLDRPGPGRAACPGRLEPMWKSGPAVLWGLVGTGPLVTGHQVTTPPALTPRGLSDPLGPKMRSKGPRAGGQASHAIHPCCSRMSPLFTP